MELNQKCQHTKPLKNGYTQKVNKETKHSNNSNLMSSIQASKPTKYKQRTNYTQFFNEQASSMQ